MTRGLLDTSVLVAREQGRALGALPDQLAISVITIGELELGVLAVNDTQIRARRADTLALARASDPLPITENVMGCYARLVRDCRGEGVRPKAFDALIAATAIDHGIPVLTRDADFDAMAAAHRDLEILRV